MRPIRALISVVVAVVSLVGIILGTLGTAILFSVDIPGLTVLPASSRSFFVISFFVVLVVSWILFFLERRALVGELTAKLDRQRHLQEAIDGLSILRSEGVITLYASRPSEEDFQEWKARFKNWEDRVVDYMKPRFTPAIVGLFSELGPLPALTFANVSMNAHIAYEHEHLLRIITKELAIMERIIQQGSQLGVEPNPTLWESLTALP